MHRSLALAVLVAGLAVGLPASAKPGAQLQAIAVDAGFDHSCAVTSAGGVTCWGGNAGGQLGDGTTLERTVPVDARGLSGVQAVSAGNHTCALTTAGGVSCWGPNSHGELGDGTRTGRRTPVPVSGISGRALAIAVGLHHTCALTDSEMLQCWGDNSKGQLGNDSTADSSTPVAVLGLTSVAGVAAGGSHTCALTRAGGVKCWGSNAHGQLGIGSIGGSSLTPVDVDSLATGMALVSLGYEHSCAVTTEGGSKCWGRDDHGQLGTINNCGTFPDWICTRPVPTDGLSSGVSAIAAGPDHTCARTSSAGALKCWGEGNKGQLGNAGRYSYTPVDVVGFQSGASKITVGAIHTCALTLAGGVACWGGNSSGQVGDGTRKNRSTPAAVLPGPTGCVVPRLKGKTLVAARIAFASTACSLAPIRRAYSANVKKGRVLSQRPASGAQLPAGGAVRVVLSKGKRGR